MSRSKNELGEHSRFQRALFIFEELDRKRGQSLFLMSEHCIEQGDLKLQ